MHREPQLKSLTMSLTRLVEILRCDSECTWTRAFEGFLQDALQASPEDQETLSGISSSIMSVYGGMGSLNDYVPANYHNRKDMRELELYCGKVYEDAVKLRVVGTY
jgi:hypothetical protein